MDPNAQPVSPHQARAQKRARLVKDRREKAMERYGLDVAGDPATVADERRRMRNARKRERQNARG